MRTEYESLLDKMYFEIGTTLIDNDYCRKGIGAEEPVSEEEILRSNKRTFMNLKVYMMRLERSLFGGQNEQTLQEIPDRDVGESEISIESFRGTSRTVGYRGTD